MATTNTRSRNLRDSDLKVISLRASASFLATTNASAAAIGLKQSEYIRKAIEEMNERQLDRRLGGLSRQLASQSAAENESMDSTLADGLGAT